MSTQEPTAKSAATEEQEIRKTAEVYIKALEEYVKNPPQMQFFPSPHSDQLTVERIKAALKVIEFDVTLPDVDLSELSRPAIDYLKDQFRIAQPKTEQVDLTPDQYAASRWTETMNEALKLMSGEISMS